MWRLLNRYYNRDVRILMVGKSLKYFISILEDYYSIITVNCQSMAGLDAAGKTTALYQLKLGEGVTTIPTIGKHLALQLADNKFS